MSSPTQKTRPRSRTMLSFGSRRSSGSNHKFTKEELDEEAAKEKPWKRMTTKANPNIAVAELEPVAQALEKPTITSNIRSMSFNDQFGNPITDPDRSNPTRPRLERPLDTIRSFEAAIDGSYNRRNSRTFEAMSPPQSRPSSFYPGATNGFTPRFPQEGNNYGNRMAPSRPESYVDPYGNRQSPLPFSNRRRSHASRNNSDPMMWGNNAQGIYNNNNQYNPPQPPFAAHSRREPQFQQPYDAVTQGSSSGGSHGTEPWSTSTDPSSEASSVERLQQMQPPAPPKHADLGEQYGFNGFGGAPAGMENGYHDPMIHATAGNGLDRRPLPPSQMQQQQRQDLPPPPPPHLSNSNVVRQPVRANTLQRKNPMGKQQPEYNQTPATRPETGEKRKSWLMRRFSKNNS